MTRHPSTRIPAGSYLEVTPPEPRLFYRWALCGWIYLQEAYEGQEVKIVSQCNGFDTEYTDLVYWDGDSLNCLFSDDSGTDDVVIDDTIGTLPHWLFWGISCDFPSSFPSTLYQYCSRAEYETSISTTGWVTAPTHGTGGLGRNFRIGHPDNTLEVHLQHLRTWEDTDPYTGTPMDYDDMEVESEYSSPQYASLDLFFDYRLQSGDITDSSGNDYDLRAQVWDQTVGCMGPDLLPEEEETVTTATYPAANHFDASSKTYLLSGDLYSELHPVDAMMAIGLLWPQGTFYGDTTIGHTLQEVDLGQPSGRLQGDVEGRVRDANPVRDLLRNGDVEIISIQAAKKSRYGRLYVQTNYRNLRTGESGQVIS